MKSVILLFSFLFLSTSHAATRNLPLMGENILSATQIITGQKPASGLVVVFLSAKCPCSDSHMEELQELHKEFSSFEFVGVHSNVDEDLEFSKKYFEGKNISFKVIQDKKAELADHFKAYKTPHAYVLSSTGEVLYEGGVTDSAHFSRANKKFLRQALLDLSANRKVQNAEGRTLGCAIAREK